MSAPRANASAAAAAAVPLLLPIDTNKSCLVGPTGSSTKAAIMRLYGQSPGAGQFLNGLDFVNYIDPGIPDAKFQVWTRDGLERFSVSPIKLDQMQQVLLCPDDVDDMKKWVALTSAPKSAPAKVVPPRIVITNDSKVQAVAEGEHRLRTLPVPTEGEGSEFMRAVTGYYDDLMSLQARCLQIKDGVKVISEQRWLLDPLVELVEAYCQPEKLLVSTQNFATHPNALFSAMVVAAIIPSNNPLYALRMYLHFQKIGDRDKALGCFQTAQKILTQHANEVTEEQMQEMRMMLLRSRNAANDIDVIDRAYAEGLPRAAVDAAQGAAVNARAGNKSHT